MTDVPAWGRHMLAAGFVALFAIGDYLVLVNSEWKHWWADLAWTAAALIAGWACLRTAGRLQGRQRTAWIFFGAGCLSWFAGMLVWDTRELVHARITPFPGLSDIGFLSLAPLFLMGLIFNYTEKPSRILKLKNAADLGVIVSAVTMACLIGFADLIRNPELSRLYVTTAVAFPVLYITTFVFALLALLRHGAAVGRVVLSLILASLALHSATDSAYAYSLLEGSYKAGHYLDVLWVIAFALTYSAAVEQNRLAARSEAGNVAKNPMDVAVRRADTIVFSGVVFAVGLLAFWNPGRLEIAGWYGLPLFLMALALFLGLREWANQHMQLSLTAEVRASESELSRILNSLEDTYYRANTQGRIEKLSPSVKGLLGYEPEELLGTSLASLYVETGGRDRFLQALEAGRGVVHEYEARVLRKDGTVVWLSTSSHYVRDSNGNVTGVEGTARDVSDRKRAEDQMYKLSSALQQTADAVIITDRAGVIEYVNPAFQAITGYSSDEAIGARASLMRSGQHGPDFYQKLWNTILGGKVFSEVFINKRKDGSLYYEAKTITPLTHGKGVVTNFVSTGKDITEQMEAQERLQYMAHHDVLTDLPNRTLFLDRVNQALARAPWHSRLAAVLFMDLDRFKYINDSLGHDVGDKLLRDVGARLRDQLRPGDTVARFGGDEFVILLEDVAGYDDIAQIAEKLLNRLRPPYSIDNMELHVTATIGISVCPNDGEDSQTLLKHADSAMYRAKDAGRDTYRYYSDDMGTRVLERLTLENSLRRALERQEFELYYQPQVDVIGQRIVGVEALLRWNHPEVGVVSPADFVPVLEETGLIVPVGTWVLEAACRQVAKWNAEGRRLSLAVNISARQFTDAGFLGLVERVVNAAAMPRELLELEMTESIFLRHTQATSDTFEALDGMGIRLAIDDFGTGYSSLSYLKRFPIRTLKIDRSFVRDVTEDTNDAALTAAIQVMAQRLGLRVVAEGVETGEQMKFLCEQGCQYAQGYLFSKPLPADQIGDLLDRSDFPGNRISTPACQ